MKKRHLLRLSCALGALVAPAAVDAQTAPTPADQSSETVDPATTIEPAQDDAQAAEERREPAPAARTSSGEPSRRRVLVEERNPDDVLVTGNRFTEVLDLPQSVSIINAEDRNLSGVGDVRQLIQVQPGFNFTDAFGLNVRGVGRQTAQTLLGQENTVIQYTDGFINLVPGNFAESTLFGGNLQFIRGPGGIPGVATRSPVRSI